jgi:glycosyltransferase involved in cell wall biosynthesis
MVLLINCSNLKKGGGIQVAHSFINELIIYSDFSFHIVLSTFLEKEIKKEIFPSNFYFYTYDIKISFNNIVFGIDYFLDNVEKNVKPKSVFTIFGPSYWKPKSPHLCGFAKPHYVYKDSPYFKSLCFRDLFFLKLKEIIHLNDFRFKSNCIVSENFDVSIRLSKILNLKPIYTVTNSINSIFYNFEPPRRGLISFKKNLNFVVVSANYPHKNLNVINEVVVCLLEKGFDRNFVFTLTLDEDEFKVNSISKNYINLIGKQSIEDVPSLYKEADVMFLPTLLECFSASYVEAMYMNVPIITSDLSFAKGICEDSAVYIDPLNPEEIADKFMDLLNNDNLYSNLINLGSKQLFKFDSSKTRAIKYLDILINKI